MGTASRGSWQRGQVGAEPGSVPLKVASRRRIGRPAWRMAFLMPLLYLGAFLSGLRPARWFGSRLFPLVAVATLLILLSELRAWWGLAFPLGILLYVLLIANVCFVARERDYA